MPLTTDRNGIAAVFGVSTKTIGEWTESGMPATKRGRSTASDYDVAACVQWRLREVTQKTAISLTLEEERLRKIKAEADTLEYQLEISKGDYVPIGEFRQALEHEFNRVKAKFMAYPTKVLPLLMTSLHSPKEAPKVSAILTKEVRECLESAASDDDLRGNEGEESASDGNIGGAKESIATTRSKRKPVGRPKGISKPRKLS